MMSAIGISFLAASCASLSNWFFHKNSKSPIPGNQPGGYLVFYYFLSLALSFVIYPGIWRVKFSLTMLIMGGCVGIFNVALIDLFQN